MCVGVYMRRPRLAVLQQALSFMFKKFASMFDIKVYYLFSSFVFAYIIKPQSHSHSHSHSQLLQLTQICRRLLSNHFIVQQCSQKFAESFTSNFW